MTELLDARVDTRSGDTGMEDFHLQIGRVEGSIWANLHEYVGTEESQWTAGQKSRWILPTADTRSSETQLIDQNDVVTVRVYVSVPDRKPPEESLFYPAQVFEHFRESLEGLSVRLNTSEAFTRATRETSTILSSLRISRSLVELSEHYAQILKDLRPSIDTLSLRFGSLTAPIRESTRLLPTTRKAKEPEEEWTEAKNARRCELIDKEIAGSLSAGERQELKRLQDEMLAYRREVAPLPIDDLRKLHEDLFQQIRKERS